MNALKLQLEKEQDLTLTTKEALDSIIDRLIFMNDAVSKMLFEEIADEISGGFSHLMQGVIDDLKDLRGPLVGLEGGSDAE